MKDIIIGTEFTSSTLVINSNTAVKVGSGEADVFATPMMISLMENAAYLCLKPFLDDGETSVGTYIGTTHESATPVGMSVSATATVTAVDGKTVTFEVVAKDSCGIIGRGEHKRVVLNAERFTQKAHAKLA